MVVPLPSSTAPTGDPSPSAANERRRQLSSSSFSSSSPPSTDSSLSRSPSSHLPQAAFISERQSLSLENFRSSLAKVSLPSKPCEVCNEHFTGMHVRRDGSCLRCHQENTQHKFNKSNNADPGDLPLEFRRIIDELTPIEELLIARCNPFLTVWLGKGGGQYKYRGNVINFFQNSVPLATHLPLLPEDVSILLVRKTDSKDPRRYKDFIVQKTRVLKALQFLKLYNPYYRDVTIVSNADLPENQSVIDRLTELNPSEDFVGGECNNEHDGDNEELENDFMVDEPTSFVPSIFPDREGEDIRIRNIVFWNVDHVVTV